MKAETAEGKDEGLQDDERAFGGEMTAETTYSLV